jgi:cytochrome c-type biogenesis protein CcmH/NrfG
VDRQPTHRDALLQLAWLTCQEGQVQRCYQAWQNAVKVDPNHPQVKSFEKVYQAAASAD